MKDLTLPISVVNPTFENSTHTIIGQVNGNWNNGGTYSIRQIFDYFGMSLPNYYRSCEIELKGSCWQINSEKAYCAFINSSPIAEEVNYDCCYFNGTAWKRVSNTADMLKITVTSNGGTIKISWNSDIIPFDEDW